MQCLKWTKKGGGGGLWSGQPVTAESRLCYLVGELTSEVGAHITGGGAEPPSL
jgi:hypothetical protein